MTWLTVLSFKKAVPCRILMDILIFCVLMVPQEKRLWFKLNILLIQRKMGMYIMTFLSRFMHMQNDIKVNLSYLLLVIMSTKKFIGEILAKLQ